MKQWTCYYFYKKKKKLLSLFLSCWVERTSEVARIFIPSAETLAPHCPISSLSRLYKIQIIQIALPTVRSWCVNFAQCWTISGETMYELLLRVAQILATAKDFLSYRAALLWTTILRSQFTCILPSPPVGAQDMTLSSSHDTFHHSSEEIDEEGGGILSCS